MPSDASGSGGDSAAGQMHSRETVRFPPDLLDAIEDAVDAGKFFSQSQAVRTAVRSWNTDRGTSGKIETDDTDGRLSGPNDTTRMTIRFQSGLAEKIDAAVQSGAADSKSAAIRAAVRQWARDRSESNIVENEQLVKSA